MIAVEFRPMEAGVKLVERNGDKPCCGSCVMDEEEGYGMGPDYCCCVHGTLFGYVWSFMLPDEISWSHPDTEHTYDGELDFRQARPG